MTPDESWQAHVNANHDARRRALARLVAADWADRRHTWTDSWYGTGEETCGCLPPALGLFVDTFILEGP